MAFPTDPLTVETSLALAADVTAAPNTWTWTDATSYTYVRDGVGITRGRPDETATADTSSLAMTVDNRDGRWSTRNPSGAWYGQLRKGTPIRVRVRRAADITDAFGRTVSNGWGTADTGQAWTTSGTAADFSVTTAPFGHAEITPSATNSNRTVVVPTATPNNDVTVDFTAQTLPASGTHRIGVIPRYSDSNNFYFAEVSVTSAGAVTLRISERIAGSQSVITSVATSITLVAGTKYRIRARCYGQRIQCSVWTTGGTPPSSWMLSAVDPSLTTGSNAGCFARNETAATTHTYRFDDFLDDQAFTRFAGFISALPPRWDVSGQDRYAPLEAKGLMYRLAGGMPRSALARTILAASPTAYWMLEDGASATRGSPAAGGLALQPWETVVFGGSLADAPGTAAGPDMSNGALSASLSGFTASNWVVEFSALCNEAVGGSAMIQIQTTGGTLEHWWINAPDAALQIVDVFAGDPSAITASAVANNVNPAVPHHYRLELAQSGGNIAGTFYVDGVPYDASLTTQTLGKPVRLTINSRLNGGRLNGSVFHVAMYTAGTGDHSGALLGYTGELAHVRAARASSEEDIICSTGAAESQPMGPQVVGTLLEVLRECEATDQGYLYEDLDHGMIFQSHTERENLDTALGLTYTTAGHVAPPLEPIDDDQQVINDIEVTRDGGSFTRLTEESASVELSVPNIGRRADSQTYSLATDGQSYHLAGWRLRRGTWPGYRIPVLTLNLAAGPSLIDSWLGADLAFRTTIASPPTDIGPDAPSLVVEGYAETLNIFDWDVAANCTLDGPNRVSLVAATSGDTDEDLGWLEFDSLTLHTTVNTSATSWSVDATPLDTTTADDFPRDMFCEGEQITVTACSGGSAPQTWTVTRSVNGVSKGHTAGALITLAKPFVMGL